MEEAPSGSGKLQQAFTRLSPRERKLLLLWIVAMVVIAGFLLSTTVLSRLDDMETRIAENQEALDLITRKQAQYLASTSGTGNSLDARLAKNDIRLTTYLDKQATRFDVKISNFKDGENPVGGKKGAKVATGIVEEWVAVDIDQVEYDKVTRLLDALQSSPELLVVKRIEITRARRGGGQDKVDAKLTVSTFKKKKEES